MLNGKDRKRIIGNVESSWNVSEIVYKAVDPFGQDLLSDFTPAELGDIIQAKINHATSTLMDYKKAVTDKMLKGHRTGEIIFANYGQLLRAVFFCDFGYTDDQFDAIGPSFERFFRGYEVPPETREIAYSGAQANTASNEVSVITPLTAKNTNPIFIQTRIKSLPSIISKTAICCAATRKSCEHASRGTYRGSSKRMSESDIKDEVMKRSLVRDTMGMKVVFHPDRTGEPGDEKVKQLLRVLRSVNEGHGKVRVFEVDDLYRAPRRGITYRAVIIHGMPSGSFDQEPKTIYLSNGVEPMSFHALTVGDYIDEHSGKDAHGLHQMQRLARVAAREHVKSDRRLEKYALEMIERAGKSLGVNVSYFLK
jgi:hypothetical protein